MEMSVKRLCLPYLVVAVAMTVSACGPQPITSIKIGAVGGGGGKNGSTGNIAVADAKGFFDEEFKKDGIKVQVVYFAGTGPALNEGLAQKQIDFAEYGALPNIIGRAGDVPARLIVARHTSGEFYVGVSSKAGINSVADLKGHSVAIQLGTMPHLLLVRLLEAHGLHESDIKLVNLESAEAQAAFTSGSVDAIVGTPVVLKLRDSGAAKIIATTAELPPQDASLGGFLVNKEFEKAYPELTARMAKVMIKTYAWESREENRNELMTLYARSGLPAKYYAEEYKGLLKDRFSPLLDTSITQGYQRIADFALQHKLIRQAPDFKGWFEPKYDLKAVKDLGLEGYWVPVGTLVASQ
jgi:sulfonate transport system substrate-binding protein